MVAHPDITISVTPPGGSPTDYTANLAWAGAGGQMSITQNFGRQGDTALFVLVDEYETAPNFAIPVLSQVEVTDNTAGQVLFAGVCNDPTLTPTGPNRNEWNLVCTDYTIYADNAIVHGEFFGQTTDQIVIALTGLADCGITAATVADGGFVAPGPQLASFILNYTTLSAAWRKLAQLAGQVTPFGWYVDENLRLHFYDATSAQPSGVTFTTIPTVAGSTTQGHISWNSFGYEWDGTSIRNRILVQGSTQTISHGTVPTSTPTDTFLGDGAQSSWALRGAVTGSPVLYVGGINTPVTVVTSGSASTDLWQAAQNANGQWFLTTTGTAPAPGVMLRTWYDFQRPIVAQANDAASQTEYTGPNQGLFVEFISDSSLTTVPMALARAQRERQEYAFAVERINFTTTEDFLGWVRSGQTCTIINQLVPDAQNSYTWGIDDTFIVVASSATFGDGGYRQSQVTAIRL